MFTILFNYQIIFGWLRMDNKQRPAFTSLCLLAIVMPYEKGHVLIMVNKGKRSLANALWSSRTLVANKHLGSISNNLYTVFYVRRSQKHNNTVKLSVFFGKLLINVGEIDTRNELQLYYRIVTSLNYNEGSKILK